MSSPHRSIPQAGFAWLALILVSASCAPALQGTAGPDTAQTRRDLEALYQQNASAFQRHDLEAVMALRTADFHSVTPDGVVQDRAAMTRYIEGFMNGVKQWNGQTVTIDSLRVAGDTAFAIVSQHLDRMALRSDNAVHHVETWVTQRETWIRARGSWLLWRVDQLRNQRRLVDGRPG
jgi:ketosteroid isomerase-like protein